MLARCPLAQRRSRSTPLLPLYLLPGLGLFRSEHFANVFPCSHRFILWSNPLRAAHRRQRQPRRRFLIVRMAYFAVSRRSFVLAAVANGVGLTTRLPDPYRLHFPSAGSVVLAEAPTLPSSSCL